MTPIVTSKNLPEASSSDDLLHIEFRPWDVGRIEPFELLTGEIWEIEITGSYKVARKNANFVITFTRPPTFISWKLINQLINQLSNELINGEPKKLTVHNYLIEQK